MIDAGCTGLVCCGSLGEAGFAAGRLGARRPFVVTDPGMTPLNRAQILIGLGRREDAVATLQGVKRVTSTITEGQSLTATDLTADGHSTNPPARFTEASLVPVLMNLMFIAAMLLADAAGLGGGGVGDARPGLADRAHQPQGDWTAGVSSDRVGSRAQP